MKRNWHRFVTSFESRDDHPSLPPRVSRPWLLAAFVVWLLASIVASEPPGLSPQPLTGIAVIQSDVIDGRFGSRALAETELGVLLMELSRDHGLAPGDAVEFEGAVRGEPGRFAGREYLASLRVRTVKRLPLSAPMPLRVGNAVRGHVMSRLEPFDDSRALLAGFLIGDTSELERFDVEAMRRSGLAHFVAVSGSNVALVLVLVAIAAGPLSLGPKRRAVVGLIAIPIYAAATRFEPSVMRASVMAAIALGGRLAGVVFEAWQLLSLAIVILLALDPSLTGSVGFQMSVAATAGVLVGARWPVGGGRIKRALAVTVGAQVSVAPLLLIHFGSVPLMSPLANLVAAPLVAGATVVGAVGVAGPGFLVTVAAWLADAVLFIARGASVWPQLDAPWVMTTLVGVVVALSWKAARLPLGVLLAASILVMTLRGSDLPDPGVIVLDIGQGDSILLHSEGRYALVDGGPDDLLLLDKLRKYGVTHLDLVVLTHVHADHASGLVGVVGRIGIGTVWASAEPHKTAALSALLDALGAQGVPVASPTVGEVFQLGSLRLTVEAPLRRYASPNDQSLVVMVEGPARSMLLPGDIETIAQAELGHLRAEVLKVPHQGGATSGPEWLAGVGAELAVISVGPNQFGHPADWVIDVLEESGAEVVRTDEAGDVAVPLG